VSPGDIEARNVAAALDLVNAGLPVFPARVDFKNGRWTKTPIIKGWQAVSADPERVREWWRKCPQAVPAIPPGRPGLVVIDADRHRSAPDGVANLEKIAAEHGGLPGGPVVRTAGGGFHFIFRQPAGNPLGNREGELAGCGINVRGGYSGWIVAPGSVCPDGLMWCTADGAPPLLEAYRNDTIPVIPPWLEDMIRATKSKRVPKHTKVESEPEAISDASATSSGKRASSRSMDQRGRAWAETVLKNGVAELAAKPPHSGAERDGKRARLSNGHDGKARVDRPRQRVQCRMGGL
jgi:hypothetical protein